MENWKPFFSASQDVVKYIPTWFSLPGLPYEFSDLDILQKIGDSFRKFIHSHLVFEDGVFRVKIHVLLSSSSIVPSNCNLKSIDGIWRQSVVHDFTWFSRASLVMESALFASLKGLSFEDKVSRPSKFHNSKPVTPLSNIYVGSWPESPPLQGSAFVDNVIGASVIQKDGDGATVLGYPFPMKDGLIINSQTNAHPAINCMDSFLPDADLISKVQKVVFDHNITSNLVVTDKVVEAIDQDLVNLNSSLVIPPTGNPFYILSDKAQEDDNSLGVIGDGDGNAGFINKHLVQFSLSPTSPSPSPAKRGRKSKAFYTQLEIDASIQSMLLSSNLISGMRKTKCSPSFTRSVASKHSLKAELVSADFSIEKRGEITSPQEK